MRNRRDFAILNRRSAHESASLISTRAPIPGVLLGILGDLLRHGDVQNFLRLHVHSLTEVKLPSKQVFSSELSLGALLGAHSQLPVFF